MKDAQASGEREALLASVRINWQLWTIIQSDLLDPDCPLPVELRSNGLSLASFVDKHTLSFLSDPKPESLDILISINREIAGGLFQKPKAEEPAGEADSGQPQPTPSRGTSA